MAENYKEPNEEKIETIKLVSTVFKDDDAVILQLYQKIIVFSEKMDKIGVIKIIHEIHNIYYDDERHIIHTNYDKVLDLFRSIIESDDFSTTEKSRTLDIIRKIICIEKENFTYSWELILHDFAILLFVKKILIIPTLKVLKEFVSISEKAVLCFFEHIDYSELIALMESRSNRYIVLVIDVLNECPINLFHDPKETLMPFVLLYIENARASNTESIKAYKVIICLNRIINNKTTLNEVGNILLEDFFKIILEDESCHDISQLLDLWKSLLIYTDGEFGCKIIPLLNTYLLENNLITHIFSFYKFAVRYEAVFAIIRDAELVYKYHR